jgi:hypothetical protein
MNEKVETVCDSHSEVDDSIATWISKWEREQEEEAANRRARFVEVLRSFPSVRSIEASYYGCGDEGSIETVRFFDVDEKKIETSEELNDLVDELVHDHLPGGWGNAEGSYGTCFINAETLTMSFEHLVRRLIDENFEVDLTEE